MEFGAQLYESRRIGISDSRVDEEMEGFLPVDRRRIQPSISGLRATDKPTLLRFSKRMTDDATSRRNLPTTSPQGQQRLSDIDIAASSSAATTKRNGV